MTHDHAKRSEKLRGYERFPWSVLIVFAVLGGLWVAAIMEYVK